jgi:hypothetical protein
VIGKPEECSLAAAQDAAGRNVLVRRQWLVAIDGGKWVVTALKVRNRSTIVAKIENEARWVTLRNFGRRIKEPFTFRGPYAQCVLVEDLFVGFKEIDEQPRGQQFKGANHVSLVGVGTIQALSQWLRAG